jgi:Smg protein|tara:strand:- start:4123 stop:4581 length:459 start_codon:yes stop_codon:yes gene_type:complete
MFEVLVFMFKNYFANQTILDDAEMEQELSEAGFEQDDILSAFNWFESMKSTLNTPELDYAHAKTAIRIFTANESKRIDTESLGFLIFLQQANVINDVERDLVIDRAMALNRTKISIEETRWITMIALWSQGRDKDYSFVEDALFNPRGSTIQ